MHAIEIICSFILVVYLLNYFLGRMQNKSYADRWLNQVRQVLADNFSVVGSKSNVSSPFDVQFEYDHYLY